MTRMPRTPRTQEGESKPRFVVVAIFPSMRRMLASALFPKRNVTKDMAIAVKTSNLEAAIAASENILSQGAKDATKPKGAFTIFQNLPAELRVKIWSLALSEHQVITLAVAKSSIPAIKNPRLRINDEMPINFYGRPDRYIFRRLESDQALDHARLHTSSNSTITTILHVNQESRLEVFKSYSSGRIFGRGTRVYVNPFGDTLFINSTEAFELVRRAVADVELALQPIPAVFTKFRFLAVKFETLLGKGAGTMTAASPRNVLLAHWLKRVIMMFGCLEEVFIVKAWEGMGEEVGFAKLTQGVLEIQMEGDEINQRLGRLHDGLKIWRLPKISVVSEEEMREMTRVR